MDNQVNELSEKLSKAVDPFDPYSYEQFIEEYGNMYDQPSNDLAFFVNLNFVNKSKNQDPEYATEGSSGFDLRANLSEPIVLGTGKRVIVPTGLFFDIPNGMEIQIRSRSGLSIKHGVVVLNGIGTIDSDYTGEIGVILINHGENDFIINHGDRIAQGVISSVIGKQLINFIKVNTINKTTERGYGGYGSTGHQ
jgi:dUTP pyrophosphatase